VELTHQQPVGRRPLIQSYGGNGFEVSGRRRQGSILVLPDGTRDWSVDSMGDLSLPSLSPIIDFEPAVELLIIGCGATFSLPPVTLRDVLRSKDIGVETMDTGAACRTYNVLAGEDRRVAAALMALRG
jgi:uncharacterized protein